MTKRYRNLWKVVKAIILKHHESFKDEFIRDVFYMIGDRLGLMIGTQITQEDYDWYNTKQGYASLRDDIWPLMEQKHGLTRPKAWPSGVVFDHGKEKSLSKLLKDMERGLEYIWNQARGFIFVEKGGVAEKLRVLSTYGWTICAGKGYPERLMRRLLKEEPKKRLVLVFHDWDRDGKGIYQALGFETRRTKHLDIALNERVVDLGLTENDVKKLKLPTRPSPPKYKGIPRVEISALSVLKMRMGIDEPTLAYVVASLMAKGYQLSPTAVDKEKMLARHLRWALTDGLRSVVEKVVKAFLADLEGQAIIEGEAVEGQLETMEIVSENIDVALLETAENLVNNLTWRYEDDFHKEAIEKFANEELTRLLAS